MEGDGGRMLVKATENSCGGEQAGQTAGRTGDELVTHERATLSLSFGSKNEIWREKKKEQNL